MEAFCITMHLQFMRQSSEAHKCQESQRESSSEGPLALITAGPAPIALGGWQAERVQHQVRNLWDAIRAYTLKWEGFLPHFGGATTLFQVSHQPTGGLTVSESQYFINSHWYDGCVPSRLPNHQKYHLCFHERNTDYLIPYLDHSVTLQW